MGKAARRERQQRATAAKRALALNEPRGKVVAVEQPPPIQFATALESIGRRRYDLDNEEIGLLRLARSQGVTWNELGQAAGLDDMTYRRRVEKLLVARGQTIRDLQQRSRQD